MQQLYDVFYKNNGIRRIQGLISPKRIQLTNLPRNSLIHYLSETPGILDVDTSKPYLNGYSKQILIDYPTVLTSTAGNPRLKSAMIQSLVRPFHKANRHYRYVKDHYKVTSDPSTLFIENYSYLEEFYRYAPNTMLAYNKWLNTYKTMWDKANEIATASDKHQFFFVKLPEVLPSYSLLKIYSAKVNLALTRIFDTPAKLMMLEIWKWLDVNYRSSSILSAVKSENLNKVNLLLEVRDGTTVIINLGVLNSFIKEDISTEDATPNTQVQAIQLQKLFLKLMITLSGSITPEEELVVDSSQDVTNASSLVPDGVTTGKTENIDADEELDTEDDPTDENVAFVGATAGDDKSMSSGLKNDSDKALADIMNNGATLTSSLKDIDEDIDTLETITKKALKSSGITIDENGELLEEEEEEVETPVEVLEAAVYGYVDPDDAVKVKVDELAEAGLLSASDYKRFMRDIEQAKQLKDPYGSGKLSSEVRTITPEDVALDKEKCTIVASELVQDKSMLQSSLNSFDADYINKVLKKDMLSMVHALQKSGVLVKKHEIEVVNSALGAYEAHTLELKPVDGMPSTIHFKLPVIDEDGTMCANGNKYKLRTQRVDRPIRKIAPSIVALTSYYGKTFVEAGAKKANNSVEWIIRQINKASIGEGEYISKVSPASLFNNRTVAPYIYNALSAHFKYIKAGIYHLHFNYGKRAELVSEDALHKLETGGKVVCGFSDKKEPIVVDEANNFFTYSKGIFTPLGNIFSVLKLPEVLSPVDFGEVRIFSKQIPVGIVLGYFIGFKNLVKLLKAKYRIVEARKNKALEPHEYAISFSDMSYVFDRRERRNSYILGGFTDYDKAIKPYPAKEFNSKHIYMNLLASKGLGSLFIREMELTEQLFVDPITKSILEEMGEPVTFNGLLIRASEMLLTYHYPDSQDTDHQRFRGYERLAGNVYKNITVAIRQYRNKNIAGKSKIDISPYQIWQTVMKDAALKIVEDINPIQNLKESEMVTYVGDGGRSTESMNKASRAYHVNDMGIVSEASVDSYEVGVNAYLSANPQFSSLRGLGKKEKVLTPASFMSTSTLLAPASDTDD